MTDERDIGGTTPRDAHAHGATRLGPPPVDALPELSWARIERGLWARLDGTGPVAVPTRDRRWLWIAAPIAAAAVLVVIVISRDAGTTRDTRTARTDGVPTASRGEPARIVSGAGPTSVTFGDAHLTLEPETAIVMSRDAAARSAVLERGAASFAIAPRAGRTFVVVAGDTRVRVIGTQFRVARLGEHATVDVEHGLVEVTYQGISTRVGPGQHWRSQRPTEVGATKTAHSQPPPARDDAPPADPDAPPAQAGDDSAATSSPVADDPQPAAGRTRAATTATRDTRTATTAAADARAATRDARAAKQAAADRDRTEYERLARLESRDAAAAIDGYLALSRGNGAWAANALYAAGRLAADRGDTRAATFLSIYLRRFPKGANAVDARDLLARLKGDSR